MFIITLLILLAIAYKAYELFIWKTVKPTFAGKTIFITGGSSGIGEALTKKLIELGA